MYFVRKSKGFFLMFSFKYEEYVIKFTYDIYNALAPAIFINEPIT